jgi:hypothetical protein
VLHWRLISDAREVARKTLNLEQLRRLRLPVPPVNEQQEIVRRIERAWDRLSAISIGQQRAVKLILRLNETLLTKAFRGELVPQNLDEETAVALLDRLRQERLQRADEPKRRGRRLHINGASTRMPKSSKARRMIMEVIAEQTTAIEPERLFQVAGFTPDEVDEFYAELKEAVAAGQVRQDERKRLVKVG